MRLSNDQQHVVFKCYRRYLINCCVTASVLNCNSHCLILLCTYIHYTYIMNIMILMDLSRPSPYIIPYTRKTIETKKRFSRDFSIKYHRYRFIARATRAIDTIELYIANIPTQYRYVGIVVFILYSISLCSSTRT